MGAALEPQDEMPTENIPFGKVDTNLASLWTGKFVHAGSPVNLRLDLQLSGIFMLTSRVFDQTGCVSTERKRGTWGRFSNFIMLRCFQIQFGFGRKDAPWVDSPCHEKIYIINKILYWENVYALTPSDDRDNSFFGCWATEKEDIIITTTAKGNFQLEMTTPDKKKVELIKKSGEWFPFHAATGIVLNVIECKDRRKEKKRGDNHPKLKKTKDVPLIPVLQPQSTSLNTQELDILEETSPLINHNSKESSSPLFSCSLSSNNSESHSGTEADTADSDSSSSWDEQKGKGKEKAKAKPKRKSKSPKVTNDLESSCTEGKWYPKEELLLIIKKDPITRNTKPTLLLYHSLNTLDEEGKERKGLELKPHLPPKPASILRKETKLSGLYAKEISQIAEMGFTGERVITLLTKFEGNVTRSIEALLAGS